MCKITKVMVTLVYFYIVRYQTMIFKRIGVDNQRWNKLFNMNS